MGQTKRKCFIELTLRQFTPRQPIPDTEFTPPEWKPDPEMIIENRYLYARVWECQNARPFLDNNHDDVVTPSSPEMTVRSKLGAN